MSPESNATYFPGLNGKNVQTLSYGWSYLDSYGDYNVNLITGEYKNQNSLVGDGSTTNNIQCKIDEEKLNRLKNLVSNLEKGELVYKKSDSVGFGNLIIGFSDGTSAEIITSKYNLLLEKKGLGASILAIKDMIEELRCTKN